MASQHTILSPVELPSGKMVSMLQANVMTRGSFGWKEWDTCQICGFDYPKDEIVYVKGGAYCQKFTHIQDVRGSGGIEDG